MDNLPTTEDIIKKFDDDTWHKRGADLVAREFKPDKLPAPKISAPDWEGARRDFKKLMVEIGCGAGHHPYEYALSHSQSMVYAIEHTKTRFKQMDNLVKQRGSLINLNPIHENAISWMAHYVSEQSLDHIMLMYPNPFLKPKDWNCRWHAMPFWKFLLTRLKPTGRIQLVTNIQDYAEQAIYFNLQHWNSRLIHSEKVSPGSQRTAFEKKYLERGETCFDLSFAPN
jgi:tRNA (guanine-N7-)-methyltransferase